MPPSPSEARAGTADRGDGGRQEDGASAVLSDDVVAALQASGIDPDGVVGLARRAVAEDLGPGGQDVTSVATVPADARGSAVFVARQEGVVSGAAVAAAVCQVVDGQVRCSQVAGEGDRVAAGGTVLVAEGSVRSLLLAERTALNLLCHLSGVATTTARWVRAVEGTGAVVRDTRKTTPGLRALEKAAVRAGGGRNHRADLSSEALVKDNHVLAAGSVTAAVRALAEQFPDVPTEVECDELDQVREAVAAGATTVLLDNMDVARLREAVAVCRDVGVRTEASGGLSLDAAAEVAATGVDMLAVGALTHSAPVLDVGVDLEAEAPREAS